MRIHISLPCQMMQIGREEVHMNVHIKQVCFEMKETKQQLLFSLQPDDKTLFEVIDYKVV